MCDDLGTGSVLLDFFSTAAKLPESSAASAGVESNITGSRYNSWKCCYNISTRQKPTLAWRKSSDIDILIGRDDDGLLMDLRVGISESLVEAVVGGSTITVNLS